MWPEQEIVDLANQLLSWARSPWYSIGSSRVVSPHSAQSLMSWFSCPEIMAFRLWTSALIRDLKYWNEMYTACLFTASSWGQKTVWSLSKFLKLIIKSYKSYRWVQFEPALIDCSNQGLHLFTQIKVLYLGLVSILSERSQNLSINRWRTIWKQCSRYYGLCLSHDSITFWVEEKWSFDRNTLATWSITICEILLVATSDWKMNW